MKITAIYDNGGKTLDRYTVVTDEPEHSGFVAMLGLSEGGNGFSQWTAGQAGKHLGKKVKLEDLSEDTQKHIRGRLA